MNKDTNFQGKTLSFLGSQTGESPKVPNLDREARSEGLRGIWEEEIRGESAPEGL